VHQLIALDIEYTYTTNLIYEIDINGIITFSNSNFAEVTGFRKKELIGKNHEVFRHPDVPDEIYEKLWSTEERLKKWFSTIKNIRRDGMYFWSSIHCTPKRDTDDNIIGFIVVHKPASKIDIEEELERYAQYD
jgi:PAS domain S-box-containing protein